VLDKLKRVDRAQLAIVAEGFLSRLSFGLISFALPLYAFQLGLSFVEIGFLASLNLIVAIALKPAMGWVADRVGLKPSLTASIGLRSLVSLLLAFTSAPWQLFGARAVHGVSISLRDPSIGALIAERGRKTSIASSFAWYQTAKSVAGSLGKSVAGVLLTLTASNFSLVFLCAFVLSALPMAVVARYIREKDATEQADHGVGGSDDDPTRDTDATGREAVPTRSDPVRSLGDARPVTWPFIVLGCLISGTAYMLANLFPIFATEYAGLTEAETGFIYLVSTLVVFSGPVFGWVSDNISQRLVLSVRSVANVVSSVLFLVAPNLPGVTAGKAVDEVGKAAFRPAWGALMAEVALFDRRRRARTMAYMSMGDDIGEILGPILAGLLWSMWGIAMVLGVRIFLAVITEVYTVAVTRAVTTRLRRPEVNAVETSTHASTASADFRPSA